MGISKEAKSIYDKKYAARKKAEALAKHPALVAECESVGLPADNVGNYWHKGEHFSIHVKTDPKKTYEEMRDEVIADMQKHSPKYPKVKYRKPKSGHLLVVDPADVHIGKLATSFETGEEYNSQIAVQRIRQGVDGLLNKSGGFGLDKIMLIIGNDILHVDGPQNTTTKGTRQDPSGMWYENVMLAKQIYIETIEKLVSIAPLHIHYDPSNHDVMSGFFLADSLSSWFHKSKDISFNTSIAHRKYMRYFKNLIGTTHGDGAKEMDLPLLMAHEAAQHWNDCPHRYIYKHHLHHKTSKDYMSVTVETLRSPSGPDGWHARNGYLHAPKAIEGFIHHPEHGQIARLTHLF